MQKILIVISFALTVSIAFAGFTNLSAWSKPLTQIVPDNSTNFTNTTNSNLGLVVTNTGELSLTNIQRTWYSDSAYIYGWTTWWQKIDTKVLTGGASSSLLWFAPSTTFMALGYIISIDSENSTGIPLLKAYQQPLAGGSAILPITIGSNANATFSPRILGNFLNSEKTMYIVYQAAAQIINATSFTIGGAASTTEYIITSSYDGGSFSGIWGQALKSTEIWAVWTEAATWKDAIIDLSSGSTNASNTGLSADYTKPNWYTCYPYSTDKTWYGTLCNVIIYNDTDLTKSTLQTYARNGTNPFFQLFSYNATNNFIYRIEPFGPYLAIFFTNSSNCPRTFSYELWNLDTLTIYNTSSTPSRVSYLSINCSSTFIQQRLPGGGIYGLVYNNKVMSSGTITNISVGVILSSSYLNTILGFIMTVVAGLFLF